MYIWFQCVHLISNMYVESQRNIHETNMYIESQSNVYILALISEFFSCNKYVHLISFVLCVKAQAHAELLIGSPTQHYGVATISRFLTITGLFCKRAIQKRRYSAKETYGFKEPTDCSHPIFWFRLHVLLHSTYSLMHLEGHSISFSNLNLIGLFSTECGKRDVEN